MALPSEPKSDLAWFAFAYVSGELTHAEAEAFERRLAQDQAAREAVAEAVALIGAVAAVPPETLPLPSTRRRWPRRWLAAGVAAAASLAVVVGLSRRGPTPPIVVAVVAPPRAGADPAGTVALAWSGLRQEFDREEEGSDERIAGLDEPEPLAVEPESVADRGLPGWLVEAAALGDHASRPEEN
jgi:hypothetical protein